MSPFIIDLDPTCTLAIARNEYSASQPVLGTLLDIPDYEEGKHANQILVRNLRDAIPKAYAIRTFAIDPTDETNALAAVAHLFDQNVTAPMEA